MRNLRQLILHCTENSLVETLRKDSFHSSEVKAKQCVICNVFVKLIQLSFFVLLHREGICFHNTVPQKTSNGIGSKTTNMFIS